MFNGATDHCLRALIKGPKGCQVLTISLLFQTHPFTATKLIAFASRNTEPPGMHKIFNEGLPNVQ